MKTVRSVRLQADRARSILQRRGPLQAALAITIALFVSACALRPPYAPPAVAPATLGNAEPSLVAEQPFDPRWWGQFEDPVLDELESRALQANHDVRIAVARVDQARAIFDEVKRDRYPTVTAGAFVDRRSEAIPGFSNTPRTISTYSAGFDAFWEIDVFGRIRNQVQSTAATAEGLAASLDDVRVSVAAEVARNYFELRGLQQRLAVAERSLANQRETLRLTQVRRDAGIGEEQDVASAGARVAGIDAGIPPLRNANRAAGASPGRADCHATRGTGCRSRAAPIPGACESPAHRRTRHTAASSS
jgi:multidrug efflux system outer membrane protein